MRRLRGYRRCDQKVTGAAAVITGAEVRDGERRPAVTGSGRALLGVGEDRELDRKSVV